MLLLGLALLPIFCGSSLSSTIDPGLTQPRAGHTATLLSNGMVLIVDGGQLDIDDLLVSNASAELFDPLMGRFSPTAAPCKAREFHTATLLPNGKVLITGGNEFNGYPTWLRPTETAELYDPVTGTFSQTGSMAIPRTNHTATLLPGGLVLIAGGSLVASAEIYDPVTETFVSIGNNALPRAGHTATVLPSGDVLIVGGQNGQGKALAEAELYNPATNTFRNTGWMAEPRVGHTATLLPNGKVLVTGGAASAALGIGQILLGSRGQASAEIYDPLTETFTPAAGMSTGRIGHTATLLPDGTVLIAGGFIDWLDGFPYFIGYQSYNTAEIYDPAADIFTPTDPLNVGRFWHVSTLLPDGRVLFTGGIGGADSALAEVETHD
jgi:hypothetical protein